MPAGYGFDVTVETLNGATLPEYGTSNLRTRSSYAQRTVSTKVESKTDQQFRIRIRAPGPFLDFNEKDLSTGNSIDTSGMRLKTISDGGKPPYDVVVRIFIDGTERRKWPTLIRLSRGQAIKEGITLEGSMVPNGTDRRGETLFKELNWVFSEIDLDIRLAQLGLSPLGNSSDPPPVMRNDDGSGPHAGGKSGKKGTIDIRLYRYIEEKVCEPELTEWDDGMSDVEGAPPTMFRPSRTKPQKPSRKDSFDQPSVSTNDDESIGPEITHLVDHVDRQKKARLKEPVRGTYPDGNQPYAIFRFQYMALSRLVSLGVANEDGSQVVQKGRRYQIRNIPTVSVSPSSQGSKRRAADGDEDAVAVLATTDAKRKKVEAQSTKPTAGPQMTLPVRLRGGPQTRWMSAQQQQAKRSTRSTSSGTQSTWLTIAKSLELN